MNNEHQDKVSEAEKLLIQIVPNGPIMIKGKAEMIDQTGKSELKTTAFALCRCGGSAKKPYCDGTHKRNGFTD